MKILYSVSATQKHNRQWVIFLLSIFRPTQEKRRRHVRLSIEEAIKYATATNLIRPFCSALLLATKKGEKRPEGERRSALPCYRPFPLHLFFISNWKQSDTLCYLGATGGKVSRFSRSAVSTICRGRDKKREGGGVLFVCFFTADDVLWNGFTHTHRHTQLSKNGW